MQRRSNEPVRRGRPPRITQHQILETALEIIQCQGKAALSLRSLARELGTVPTAIYTHVRDKEELLRSVTSLALERVHLGLPPEGSWTQRLQTWMHQFRAELQSFPELPELLSNEVHRAGEFLPFGSVLVELAELLEVQGLSARASVIAAQGLMWTVLGFFNIESGARRLAMDKPSAYRRLIGSSKRGKTIERKILPHLDDASFNELFASIVRRTIDGLEVEVRTAKRKVKSTS